jgi:hypothetical protein
MAVSELLAAADRRELRRWRGAPESSTDDIRADEAGKKMRPGKKMYRRSPYVWDSSAARSPGAHPN